MLARERTAATMPKTRALDPFRAYVIMLRKGRGLDTEALAKGAAIKQRTYEAWERGETDSIKLDMAKAVVKFLGGSWAHVEAIDDLSVEEATALAERWLKMSQEDIDAAQDNALQMERIIALTKDDPVALDDVLRELRDKARTDPGVIDLVIGLLAGRRSSR